MRTGHVLIVDDDDTIREVAQTALELVAGWQVTTASGGEEALHLAVTHEPDVILLDVMMPVVDGPATLNRLRTDPRTRDIPVVFLTAKAVSGAQQEWAADGAVGVIAKPFDPMTLAQEISRLLGREDRAAEAAETIPAQLTERAGHRNRERCVQLRRLCAGLGPGTPEETWSEAAALAHQIQGSSGTFGNAAASAAARELVQALRARQPSAATDRLASLTAALAGPSGPLTHR